MPPPTIRRIARTRRLFRHYAKARKASEKHFRQRTARLRRLRHQIHATWNRYHTHSSDSTFSSDFSSGSSGRHPDASSSSSSDDTSLSDDLEDSDMPGLEDLTDEDFDNMDTESDEEEEGYADDEMSEDEDNDLPRRSNSWRKLRLWVQDEVTNMYVHRYEAPRDQLPRATGQSQLHHVLTNLKHERPDEFRADLRITPATFDALVEQISNDPVFANNSGNPQLPIEIQLTVMLYRLGHDGNASGLRSTSKWAGVGKGTVHKYTRRIMTAILRPEFMKNAVRWPTEAEKEEAKEWVEKHSCKAWRNGWCMVDGTLIPMTGRPMWYGESYFDRKCRYSLNLQVYTSCSQCQK